MEKSIRNIGLAALVIATIGIGISSFSYGKEKSYEQNKIIFMSYRDGNAEIYIMNSDGSEQKNLTNNPADDKFPSWSPDGKKIAFTSKRDGNEEIYIMNSDGSEQKNLTNNPGSDAFPYWSPKREIF